MRAREAGDDGSTKQSEASECDVDESVSGTRGRSGISTRATRTRARRRDWAMAQSLLRRVARAVVALAALAACDYGTMTSWVRAVRASEDARGGVLVAIGDVHGDPDAARRALMLAGVVDDDGAWWRGVRGGEGGDVGAPMTVVQTGDLVDRGDGSVAAVDMFERLKIHARDAGDELVCLIGNHELMVLQHDLRFVSREELAALGRESLATTTDESSGTGLGLRAYYYAGVLSWKKMFARGEERGEVLRNKPVAVIRGRGRCATAFAHAGLLPTHFADHDAPGVDDLNARMRELIDVDVVGHSTDALIGNDGPVWTRELSQGAEAVACAYAENVTQRLGVRRIVVGHTVTKSGQIETRCNGLIHMIDVGMSVMYGGTPSAWMCDEDEGPVAISSTGARTPLES